MKPLGPADQPFELSDGILAFCLYLAGVRFLTTRNVYSADCLRKHGFKGEIDMIEAALECVATNKKGNVKYLFERPHRLKSLLEIFIDQERRLKEDDGDAMEVIHGLMEQYGAKKIDLHEAVMRIGCVILKLRGPFLNHWKQQVPLVQIDNPGRVISNPDPRGGRLDQHPGFKILSANASEKTKKHMGLA